MGRYYQSWNWALIRSKVLNVMQLAIKNAILHQFRGRKRAWILAMVVSSAILAARFLAFRPTCDLMFHPADVAREYAVAWIVLFAFIGVTNRARVMIAVGVLLWLGTKPMIEYRIPTNEVRAVWRLNEMQSQLRSAKASSGVLSEILGPDSGNIKGGYQFEYLPDPQESAAKHPVIKAKPQCYCMTGQRSFTLDDSGAIHYTAENRSATLSDPVVRD